MTLTEIKPCLELKTLDAYRYFQATKLPKYKEIKNARYSVYCQLQLEKSS